MDIKLKSVLKTMKLVRKICLSRNTGEPKTKNATYKRQAELYRKEKHTLPTSKLLECLRTYSYCVSKDGHATNDATKSVDSGPNPGINVNRGSYYIN